MDTADLPSHVEGENLNVDLTMAKALGGKGDAGKTNPYEFLPIEVIPYQADFTARNSLPQATAHASRAR